MRLDIRFFVNRRLTKKEFRRASPAGVKTFTSYTLRLTNMTTKLAPTPKLQQPTPDWIQSTIQQCDERGYRLTPVFKNGKTKPFGKGQNYTSLADYKNAVAIGLCLDDCILIDYDENKAKESGESITSLEDLASKFGLDEMPPPVQMNDDGDSLHWLFSIPHVIALETLKQSKDGWMPYIDIKTGNQLIHLKPHNHIAGGALPHYEDLPSCTSKMLEVLAKTVNDDLTAQPSPAAVYSFSEGLREAEEILSFIDPDLPRDDWLKVLCGIKQRFPIVTEHNDLADRWSRGDLDRRPNKPKFCPRYQSSSSVNRDLASLTRTNGITFATVCHMAAENGADLSAISKMFGSASANRTLEGELVDRYTYVVEQDKFLDHMTGGLVTPVALNRSHKSATSKSASASDLVLSSPNASIADNLTWHPSSNKILMAGQRRLANTCRPPELKPIEGDVTPWLNHLAYLIPNIEQREHLLDWMAFTLQNPDIKINHQILWGGKPRIGKDAAIQPLIKALGAFNTTQPTATEVKGSFNGWAADTKLVVVQEIAEFENHSIENQLKPLCAAPPESLRINLKGVKQYCIPNLLSMIFMTNDRQPIPISASNDRFFCIWSDSVRKSDEYYAELYAWIADNAANVSYFLHHRDLSNFNHGALPPRTSWRDEIAGFSVDNLTMDVATRIEEREAPFGTDLVSLNESADILGVKIKTLSKTLTGLGAIKRKVKFRLDGGKPQTKSVWIVRNHDRYEEPIMNGQALYEQLIHQQRGGGRL